MEKKSTYLVQLSIQHLIFQIVEKQKQDAMLTNRKCNKNKRNEKKQFRLGKNELIAYAR